MKSCFSIVLLIFATLGICAGSTNSLNITTYMNAITSNPTLSTTSSLSTSSPGKVLSCYRCDYEHWSTSSRSKSVQDAVKSLTHGNSNCKNGGSKVPVVSCESSSLYDSCGLLYETAKTRIRGHTVYIKLWSRGCAHSHDWPTNQNTCAEDDDIDTTELENEIYLSTGTTAKVDATSQICLCDTDNCNSQPIGSGHSLHCHGALGNFAFMLLAVLLANRLTKTY